MPARWCPGIVWFRPLPFPAKTGRKLAYGGDLAMGERASLICGVRRRKQAC